MYVHGVPKKQLSECRRSPRIPTTIEFCGAKFSHAHDLGAFDQAQPTKKKRISRHKHDYRQGSIVTQKVFAHLESYCAYNRKKNC